MIEKHIFEAVKPENVAKLIESEMNNGFEIVRVVPDPKPWSFSFDTRTIELKKVIPDD